MKTLKYDSLNFINDEIVIYLIADCHIGSEYFNQPKLQEVIDEVLEKDNAYVILNGDLIDNATKNSVSFDYDGLTPSASLGLCLQLMKPLADAGKILCINSGNHEDRSDKEVNLNPTAILAQALGIEKCYSQAMTLLFITHYLGRKENHRATTFTVLSYHGNGNGVRVGSKANKVEDLSKIINCDVYCMSHVHTPMTFKEDYLVVDSAKGIVKPATRQFVISNSFLNYGGYGEKKGMTPTSICVPKIHLVAKGRRSSKIDRTEKHTFCEV